MLSLLNTQGEDHLIVRNSTEASESFQADLFDLSKFWRPLLVLKTKSSYEVFAELLTIPPTCPHCSRLGAVRPNGTLVQSLIDQPIHDRFLRINFVRHRYRCSCGRNLLQPLADNFKGHSLTSRAAIQIALDILDHSYEFSAAKVGVSSKMAKNIFADIICDLEAAREISLPEVIGIDGVCVGHRYKRTYCLITDISKHKIIDLLSKSTELELARFLKQLPGAENLKVVVIDMARGFFVVIQKLFPRATIVIDPYHVLRMLNDAVTAVVNLKKASLSKSAREELMKGGNRFLLLKRRSELTEDEKEQLKVWFERIPEFKLAFELKEEVFDIWRLSQRIEAEKRYDDWLKKIPKDLEEPFRKFTGAVRRWRRYIFNYFDHRVTNAFTESKNRDVKSLQRQGRRTSFTILRARLLYTEVLLKPHDSLSKLKPHQVREVVRKARRLKSTSIARDPNSYIARIEAARKSKNEFSRLLRPPQGWLDRFGHYSCYSEQESPYKWDFIW